MTSVANGTAQVTSPARVAEWDALSLEAGEPLYFASRGFDGTPVDYGFRLFSLVEDLKAGWSAGDGDVCVWFASGDAWRVVAVLRDSIGGGPLVTWL